MAKKKEISSPGLFDLDTKPQNKIEKAMRLELPSQRQPVLISEIIAREIPIYERFGLTAGEYARASPEIVSVMNNFGKGKEVTQKNVCEIAKQFKQMAKGEISTETEVPKWEQLSQSQKKSIYATNFWRVASGMPKTEVPEHVTDYHLAFTERIERQAIAIFESKNLGQSFRNKIK